MAPKYRIGYQMTNHRGQIMVYDPDNPMARSNGFTPRSRIVMSAVIGRPLTPDERVWHKDENVQNDDPDNLVLFPNHKALQQHRSQLYSSRKQEELKAQLDSFRNKATKHQRAVQEARKGRTKRK